MSILLRHLSSSWQVNQAILKEAECSLTICFGRDTECMHVKKVPHSVAEHITSFAVIYIVNIEKVPSFNKIYEL